VFVHDVVMTIIAKPSVHWQNMLMGICQHTFFITILCIGLARPRAIHSGWSWHSQRYVLCHREKIW